jgi:hypothetical protein
MGEFVPYGNILLLFATCHIESVLGTPDFSGADALKNYNSEPQFPVLEGVPHCIAKCPLKCDSHGLPLIFE